MKKERVIKYKGEKIDIYFHVDRCNHFATCLSGAPEVFNLIRRPWIKPDAASPDKIARVIETCPTGALHYKRHDNGPTEKIPTKNTVKIARNGPLYISGNLEVDEQYHDIQITDTRLGLCRCGKASVMPFCNGEHLYQGYLESGKFPEDVQTIEPLEQPEEKLQIKAISQGPYILNGPFTIRDSNDAVKYQGAKTTLCSCGRTKKSPFCDGSHNIIHKTNDK
ncbi:CDGSH iron-sulfur domain-containing protein [bacterium]|nr:CDGSH iron-sulfur domain-containing protein [bacterium]